MMDHECHPPFKTLVTLFVIHKNVSMEIIKKQLESTVNAAPRGPVDSPSMNWDTIFPAR